jgi:hypothetical protein
VEGFVSASQPGPLAEEAARLVEAIGEWARGAVGDPLHGVGDGPECQICPVCQILSLARRAQPETFAHLVEAATSLMAALRSVIDQHDSHGWSDRGVERIDLE